MKKLILLLVVVLGLTLFSFSDEQQKKVVRLKNGNYKVYKLKMKKEDLKILQQVAGWNTVALYGVNDTRTFIDESAVKDAITFEFYSIDRDDEEDDDEKKDDDKKEETEEAIDRIMSSYL